MKRKHQKIDRRKNRRFIAKSGAFAALSHNNQLGQILNISYGGLAFRYIEDISEAVESQELKIVMPQSDFFLDQILFKTITDVPVEQNLPFRSIQMRQAGLQFRNLTPRQERKLKQFIIDHTMGET